MVRPEILGHFEGRPVGRLGLAARWRTAYFWHRTQLSSSRSDHHIAVEAFSIKKHCRAGGYMTEPLLEARQRERDTCDL